MRQRSTGGDQTIRIACEVRTVLGRATNRTAEVGSAFGLPPCERKVTLLEPVDLRLGPGRLIALVGPSGSGKTTALEALERRFPASCRVGAVSFPDGVAVVDRIAPGDCLEDALSILTRCGLGEPALWIRPFRHLSEGEKFRARLARAIALHAHRSSRVPLLCDEFGSLLHRRAARAIAYGLRRLTTQYGLTVVVASAHDDILPDLQPDQLIRFDGRGRSGVGALPVRPGRTFSLRRRMRIEAGGKRDYDSFAAMHYRATDELGFVDKVFVLRERRGGDPLGIVVYAHPPLELAMRNRCTDNRFRGNPARLNREMRILRRLVIHPDVRGCGLGHFLVRKTLPLAGTRFVECLASMGAYNPVFEKAGMTRIGRYETPAATQEALRRLRSMGINPAGRDFPDRIARRRRVRAIVAGVVRTWYEGTTGRGERRVEKQSPQRLAQTFRALLGSRPVYYLWERRANPKE